MQINTCKMFSFNGGITSFPLHTIMAIRPKPYPNRRLYKQGIAYCNKCVVKFSKQTFIHNRKRKFCVCCESALRHSERSRKDYVKRI